MKVLFDTNIVLDVLMDRAPHADAAVELFSKVENGSIIGYLGATTITTIYYLIAKAIGPAQADSEIRKLLTMFEVAPVNRAVLESALAVGFSDFEDAVIAEAAVHAGADTIVTRNRKDFKPARIPVYSSTDLAKILSGA